MKDTSTLDPEETERFRRLADLWWDRTGPMRPLHDINPFRLDFICDSWQQRQGNSTEKPLEGVRVLDIGCGGGLLAEGLSARGAEVLGIDGTGELVEAARMHAEAHLPDAQLKYLHSTAESLLPDGAGQWDLVCCLEVIEHVQSPKILVQSCRDLVRPGGMVVFSTINRTLRAFLAAIVGAEYLLGLLPKGTHSYDRLIRPSELAEWSRRAGLVLEKLQGMGYNPLTGKAFFIQSPAVNYWAVCSRPEE